MMMSKVMTTVMMTVRVFDMQSMMMMIMMMMMLMMMMMMMMNYYCQSDCLLLGRTIEFFTTGSHNEILYYWIAQQDSLLLDRTIGFFTTGSHNRILYYQVARLENTRSENFKDRVRRFKTLRVEKKLGREANCRRANTTRYDEQKRYVWKNSVEKQNFKDGVRRFKTLRQEKTRSRRKLQTG